MRAIFLLVAVAAGCGDQAAAPTDLSAYDDLAVTVPADLAAIDLARGIDGGLGGDGGLFAKHDKVDILFMVDNSPSMSPKQALLQQGFPAFAQALQNAGAVHPASYHIGVVTSDLGAGPFTLNQGQCHPGGDGAKLRSAPAAGATGVPPACANLMLGGGARYIDYDQKQGTTNIQGGLDVGTAFACISSVGESGCGFESQLESAYQALHGAIAENVGFLRIDALLVVIFVTDEDDCSAPPTSSLFDPSTAGIQMYGVEHSFRCTQYGIACGNPATAVQPIAQGPLAGCRPLTTAEGGALIDAQKYVDYYRLPAAMGGVKVDPTDVILGAIAAPATPFSTAITMPCADQVNTASCAILSHSCTQAGSTTIFGDPAVRLATVVGAAATSQQSSACDADYTSALQAMADKIVARLY
ncbi:MAG: hypothetical protein JWM53_2791 [bacterium]|nr:hypothetical protein [bacterium]